MDLFLGALLLLVGATALAAVLGYRLKRNQPGLYAQLDGPAWWSRGPHFWVYHFVSPSKFRALGRPDRLLAIASIAALTAGLLLLAALVLDFARHGSF
jgi:hypothetical protein